MTPMKINQIPTPKEVAQRLQGLDLEGITKLLTIWKYQIKREAIDEDRKFQQVKNRREP
jgi:hypothetical protein